MDTRVRLSNHCLDNQIRFGRKSKMSEVKYVKSGKNKPARKRVQSPFAKNLKQLLHERGISQRGAGEIAGVNVAVIHDWLNGSQPNDPMAVLRLANALRCDFQWLLTGTRSQRDAKNISISEVFDIQDDPAFSGIFVIEAKRLKRKDG